MRNAEFVDWQHSLRISLARNARSISSELTNRLPLYAGPIFADPPITDLPIPHSAIRNFLNVETWAKFSRPFGAKHSPEGP